MVASNIKAAQPEEEEEEEEEEDNYGKEDNSRKHTRKAQGEAVEKWEKTHWGFAGTTAVTMNASDGSNVKTIVIKMV